MPLQIYKKKQGLVVRWITFACVAILLTYGAYRFYATCFPSESSDGQVARFFLDELTDPVKIPLVDITIPITPRWLLSTFLGILYIFLSWYFCFLNKRTCDFFIDTESEMRKVSWPTFKKVVGSSIVVIITIVVLGAYLFATDIGLALLFRELFY